MFTLNVQILVEEAPDETRYTATVREMPGVHVEAISFPVLCVKLYSEMITWAKTSPDVHEAINQFWRERTVRNNIFGPLREEDRG